MGCGRALSILGVVALVVGLTPSLGADPFQGADPLWNLLHEPAVARDLGLTPAKQREVRGLLDEMDAKFFPLRNQPPATSLPAADALVAETMRRLDGMLSPEQLRRITEIGLRQRGPAALVQPPLAERIRSTNPADSSTSRWCDSRLDSTSRRSRSSTGERSQQTSSSTIASRTGSPSAAWRAARCCRSAEVMVGASRTATDMSITVE